MFYCACCEIICQILADFFRELTDILREVEAQLQQGGGEGLHFDRRVVFIVINFILLKYFHLCSSFC